MVRVVGVRFKPVGKVYYFDPMECQLDVGAKVIVETARGLEYGDVCIAPREVDDSQVVQPLKPVLRLGTERDWLQAADNKQRERDAFSLCLEKIEQHKLEMNLVDAEFTFDAAKAVFYFTAEGRVDFRELVKDLAGALRCRIEMRQIGVRDEAKLIGGIGPCGRILCCTSFLSEFQPVSIRMAKDQNLSLNPTKISGVCGRLMCCLRYEQDQYEDAKKDPTLAPGYVPPVVYASPEGLAIADDEGSPVEDVLSPPVARTAPVAGGGSAPGGAPERRSALRPPVRPAGEPRPAPAPGSDPQGAEGRREGRRRHKRNRGGGAGAQDGQALSMGGPTERETPSPGGQRPSGQERRQGGQAPPPRPAPGDQNGQGQKTDGNRRPGPDQGRPDPGPRGGRGEQGGRLRQGPVSGNDRRQGQGAEGAGQRSEPVSRSAQGGPASTPPGPGKLAGDAPGGTPDEGGQRRTRRRPRRRGGRRKDQPQEPPSP